MTEIEIELTLAVEIVSAYVGNNMLPFNDIGSVVGSVYAALLKIKHAPAPEAAPPKPAVPPRKSVGDDFIICLEDGRRFKSLKRHLRSEYGLSPQQYREKWGLDADYPMVAPGYAKERSSLAKQMGLGQSRRPR